MKDRRWKQRLKRFNAILALVAIGAYVTLTRGAATVPYGLKTAMPALAAASFTSAVAYSTGTTPVDVAAADFDRDGDPDLAVTNLGSDNVSVFLNNGSGTYAAAVNYASGGTGARGVIAADVDKDGDLDLAVTNSTSASVSILLNNGNGTFAAAVDYSVGSSPRLLASGDFNRDGYVDLAISNSGGANISVLINNGDGTFAAAADYSVGTTPTSVFAADLDKDGDLDLAVNNAGSANVSILLNSGTGTFAAATNYSTDSGPSSVRGSDIDLDGDIDLATANNTGTVSLLLNNGNGTFAAATNFAAGNTPQNILLTDLDNDGDADIALTAYGTSTVAVFLNDHTGTFSSGPTMSTGNGPIGIASVDVDRDGDKDLVSANSTANTISVLVNNGTNVGSGAYTTSVNYSTSTAPFSVTTADFNADGKIDVATANSTGANVSVLINSGSGIFAAPVNYAIGGFPVFIINADFNRDGKSDLAASTTGNIAVLLNNGDGTFAAAVNYATSTAGGTFAADVNGDGAYDIVAARNGSGDDTVSVFLNNGNGTFAAEIKYPVGSLPTRVTGADFNHDGHIDLAVSNAFGNSVSVLLNNGSGTFAAPVNYATTSPGTIYAADYNRDGIADFAVTNSNGASSTVSFFPNNGNGTFGAATTFAIGANPNGLAAADLRNNGNLDLAVAHQPSSANRAGVLLNNGSGSFASVVNYSLTNQPTSVALADVNNDGNVDMIQAMSSANSVAVFLNRGAIAAPISVTPALNAVSASVSANLVFVFSQAIDGATVTAANLPVYGSQTGKRAGSYSVSTTNVTNDTITFDPSTNFYYGESVRYVFTSGVKFTNGVAAAPQWEGGFTVQTVSASNSFTLDSTKTLPANNPAFTTPVDYDADGDVDIAAEVATGGNSMNYYTNGGGAAFADGVAVTGLTATDALSSHPAVADFNNDGLPDFAVTSVNTGVSTPMIVYRSTGSGFAIYSSSANTGFDFYIDAADMNGDGLQDIVAATVSTSPTQLRIYRNDGGGVFTNASQTTIGTPDSVATGDFDQDGDIDVAIGINTSIIKIFRNDGGLQFTDAQTLSPGARVIGLAAFNVDGDSDVDLVATTLTTPSTFIVYKNDGTGTFASFQTLSGGSSGRWLAPGDLDGDGDLDVAVSYFSGSEVRTLNNDGSGTFSLVNTLAVGAGPRGWPAVADYNGDGRLDIAVSVGSVKVYVNGSPNSAPVLGYDVDNVIPAAQVTQATDGSGSVTVNFKARDGESNSVTLLGFEYSSNNGTNWTSVLTGSGAFGGGWPNNGGGGYATAPTFGAASNFTVNTKHADLSALNTIDSNQIRFRFQASDGSLTSALAVSDAFTVDNTIAALAAANIATRPVSGATTVTLSGSFTESHPGTNLFQLELNGGGYGAGTAGQSGTATPANQATAVGATLNGDDVITKVKVTHTDAYGNVSVNENTSLAASLATVQPLAPAAPTVTFVSSVSAKVVVNPHPSETGSVLYSIKIAGPSTLYVQADGTTGASQVFQSAAAWGGAGGITVTGLLSNTNYEISVNAKNPNGDQVQSAFGSPASVTLFHGAIQLKVLPAAPTAQAAESMGPSSIRWNFLDNASNEIGFRLFGPDGAILQELVQPNAAWFDETGLLSNTAYGGRTVRSFNEQGVSPSSAVFSSVATLMPPLTATVVSRGLRSLTVGVQEQVPNIAAGKSALLFELIASASGTQASAALSSDWITSEVYTFKDLEPEQSYAVRVRARNQAGVETDFSAITPVETLSEKDTSIHLQTAVTATAADGQKITHQPLMSGNDVLLTYEITNAGSREATNVFFRLPLPVGLSPAPTGLFADGLIQSDAVDEDIAQASPDVVAGIWSRLLSGQTVSLSMRLQFAESDEQITSGDTVDFTLQAGVSATETSEVFLTPLVNVSYETAGALLPSVPEESVLAPIEIVPPPTLQEVQQMERIFVPEQGGAQDQTPSVSQEGASYNLEVRNEQQSVAVSGYAVTDSNRIEFTGTSAPNTTITLIFNNNTIVMTTSDAMGEWQTYVSAEQLGIKPGDTRNIRIETIAVSGDLQSARVPVGEVNVALHATGELQAEFLTTLTNNVAVTAFKRVQTDVKHAIQAREPQIQTTLAITLPAVVIASAPIWGYLPYVPTLLFHALSYVLAALGSRKRLRRRFYGVIYDSISKQPLVLAIIRVYRVTQDGNKKLINTVVSDARGRYDALLEPGRYSLEVTKPSYQFPSRIVNQDIDASFEHVYHPEQGVSVEGEQITIPDVPLDPVNKEKVWQTAHGAQKVWMAIQRVGSYLDVPVLLIGTLASFAVLAAVPDKPLNWVLAIVYVGMLTMALRVHTQVLKAWGVVYDLASNAVLPLTTIQLIDPSQGKVVASRLTDYKGRFSFMPEPGHYVVKASKPGYEQIKEVLEAPKDHHPQTEIDIKKRDQRIVSDVAMREQG